MSIGGIEFGRDSCLSGEFRRKNAGVGGVVRLSDEADIAGVKGIVSPVVIICIGKQRQRNATELYHRREPVLCCQHQRPRARLF
jgi:hypothetical protein